MGKDEPGSKGNRKQDDSSHSKNLALIRATEAERFYPGKHHCLGSVCKGVWTLGGRSSKGNDVYTQREAKEASTALRDG